MLWLKLLELYYTFKLPIQSCIALYVVLSNKLTTMEAASIVTAGVLNINAIVVKLNIISIPKNSYLVVKTQ